MELTVLFLCIIAVPLIYFYRKIKTSNKLKQIAETEAYIKRLQKAAQDEFRAKCRVKDLNQTLPVDLLQLQLCMLESKIYNKIDPKTVLSAGELSSAMKSLEECKHTTLPSVVIEVIKRDKGTRANIDAGLVPEARRNQVT